MSSAGTTLRFSFWLQWGRALSSAEMTQLIRLAPVASCDSLQWGRALSSAEIRIFRMVRQPVRPASMGPRPFERGNQLVTALMVPGVYASMGPRPFERGNGNLTLARRGLILEQLQWGRALSSAEIRLTL